MNNHFGRFETPAQRAAWVEALFGLAPGDDTAFNRLARELFAWQFNQVLPFQRLCRARDVTPETFTTWRDIPAVPQALFKETLLFVGDPAQAHVVYQTSGTTTGQPGRQYLRSPDIYRAVAVAGAERIGLLSPERPLHFLAPPPSEAPSSSLSAMFGFWQERTGSPQSRFWLRGITDSTPLDLPGLHRALQPHQAKGEPIGIAGTAFSFVHFLDAAAADASWELPAGSWLLETGGFKGRSREVPKAELYANLANHFGLLETEIWNEYGMSELSSQAYLRGVTGAHEPPPWARVQVVDPSNGCEVAVGERGLVQWVDLANTDSVLALQTLDLAERSATLFTLLGRLPKTEPRGCSLGVEDLFRASANSKRQGIT